MILASSSGDLGAMSTPVREYAQVIARLCDEFGELPQHRVERCVADVCACASHLGFEITPMLVENIAHEHLAGAVKSRPPSTPLPIQRAPTP